MPPYMFAELERRVEAKRDEGIDVISLGIGDPDTPTFRYIVEAMRAAVGDPGTQKYPSNRGRPEFRSAFSDFYGERFGVEIDPVTEVIPAIGAKECIYNLCFAFLDPGDTALASDPGYPVYTGGPVLAGGGGAPPPAAARSRFRPGPGCDPGGEAGRRPAAVHQLSEQPDRRRRPGRLLRARRGARPASTRSSSSTTTRTRRRRTTVTSLPASSPPPGRRRWGSRCSRSPRATT